MATAANELTLLEVIPGIKGEHSDNFLSKPVADGWTETARSWDYSLTNIYSQ